MESSENVLSCTCRIETIDKTGAVLKTQTLTKAELIIGRNQFQDVVLKVSYPEGKQGPYTIKDYKIHKRFVQEGKATISLQTQQIHLMVSNCPTELLKMFLKCLLLKLTARGALQGSRQHLSGDVSTEFETISPLNVRDLEQAKQNIGGEHNKENNVSLTPKRTIPLSKSLKRKLCELKVEPNNSKDPTAPPLAKKPLLLKTSCSSLSEDQLQVINVIKNGDSVFITGSAGTGKSYLLQRIIGMLPPDTTYCTASTGAAACIIGGTTLHSFAGINTDSAPLKQCISMAMREHKAIHWKRCKVLLIDEISMVDGEFFDKLEAVARAVRKSKKPFGGIQLVLCGDFLQLPPVSKDGKKKLFCFQAESWRKCVNRTIELNDVYRQKDREFIAILQNIRIGRCPPAITKLLRNTENQLIEKGGIRATKLYTHTNEVESTNQTELNALVSEGRRFDATDNQPNCMQQLNALCPVPHTLVLKIGAQVMLTKNIDVSRSLVNGARGIVTSFTDQGFPVVQFTSGLKETIGFEKWTFHTGGGNALSRKQLPLKLAWAMSIHKSQGMTLDCVEISLGGVFETGQAYVALSRAKSLKTLRVKGFDPSRVQANKDVLEYYRNIRRIKRATHCGPV